MLDEKLIDFTLLLYLKFLFQFENSHPRFLIQRIFSGGWSEDSREIHWILYFSSRKLLIQRKTKFIQSITDQKINENIFIRFPISVLYFVRLQNFRRLVAKKNQKFRFSSLSFLLFQYSNVRIIVRKNTFSKYNPYFQYYIIFHFFLCFCLCFILIIYIALVHFVIFSLQIPIILSNIF